jgi:hypothetical protein
MAVGAGDGPAGTGDGVGAAAVRVSDSVGVGVGVGEAGDSAGPRGVHSGLGPPTTGTTRGSTPLLLRRPMFLILIQDEHAIIGL